MQHCCRKWSSQDRCHSVARQRSLSIHAYNKRPTATMFNTQESSSSGNIDTERPLSKIRLLKYRKKHKERLAKKTHLWILKRKMLLLLFASSDTQRHDVAHTTLRWPLRCGALKHLGVCTTGVSYATATTTWCTYHLLRCCFKAAKNYSITSYTALLRSLQWYTIPSYGEYDFTEATAVGF